MAACADLGGKGQYGLAFLPQQPHQLVIGTICQAHRPLHNVHFSHSALAHMSPQKGWPSALVWHYSGIQLWCSLQKLWITFLFCPNSLKYKYQNWHVWIKFYSTILFYDIRKCRGKKWANESIFSTWQPLCVCQSQLCAKMLRNKAHHFHASWCLPFLLY